MYFDENANHFSKLVKSIMRFFNYFFNLWLLLKFRLRHCLLVERIVKILSCKADLNFMDMKH